MKSYLLIALAACMALTITACETLQLQSDAPAAPAKKHTRPENSVSNAMHNINCSGADSSFEACYDKADKLCPGGYEVLEHHTGDGLYPSSASRSLSGHGIVVKCGAPS